MNKWIAIVVISFFILLGWSDYNKNKEIDCSSEYVAELNDYKDQLNSRCDTLGKVLERQRDLLDYILILKKDVDSLKAIKR